MILRTTRALAGSVLRALTILLLVILVGLALYVSVGRQLAPRVADYKNWLEQRLSQELGARVSIAQLSGEWLQFSPRFVLEDLRLGDENALYLERVSITPSLLESLKQRRLVIGSTDIQALEISMRQQSDGRWQLVGLSGSGPAVDSEMIFQLVTRLSHLSLTDASLQFEDSDGNTAALQQTRLDLQNNAGSHMLRVQAMFPDNPAILRAEAELTGSLLSELGGQVYVNFPQADYSIFMPALAVGGDTSASITNTDMAGEIWLELQQGQLHNLVLKARGGLALSSHSAGQAVEELTIENMQINSLHVSRDPATDAWGVYLDDLTFELDGQAWPQGDILFDYQPGQLARLQANALDLGILSRASVVLPVDQSLSAELTGFNPRGQLRQVALSAGFNGSTLDSISLTSNVSEGAISAFRGAPSFWGVDGYAEFNFDAASAQGSGFVEVDSSSLSMHLPNLFNDIWNYDRINGRVGFRVNTSDDVWIRIASGVIVAESDIVKARGQFATEIQLGDDRYIELELKLGALEADVGRKTPYLPTAPAAPQSVQGVLDWVDSAVLAGNGAGSGLIFRGRIQRGASAAERTLQMFYRVTDGTLKFDPAWPALEELDGTVLIDNGEVDIAARAGSTLGINFNSSIASVRPNPGGGRWLNVSGQGRGSAAQGLKYLQQ
ncbi:MAG: hypothetical protein KKD00_01320, partial [Gammaproteobacteria bacterium]|nr:hypothetical protein [Gammaproteobacteria bacterium]